MKASVIEGGSALNKALSVLMALVLAVSLAPLPAYAETPGETVPEQEQQLDPAPEAPGEPVVETQGEPNADSPAKPETTPVEPEADSPVELVGASSSSPAERVNTTVPEPAATNSATPATRTFTDAATSIKLEVTANDAATAAALESAVLQVKTADQITNANAAKAAFGAQAGEYAAIELYEVKLVSNRADLALAAADIATITLPAAAPSTIWGQREGQVVKLDSTPTDGKATAKAQELGLFAVANAEDATLSIMQTAGAEDLSQATPSYSDTLANVWSGETYFNAAAADDPQQGTGTKRTLPNASVEVSAGSIAVTVPLLGAMYGIDPGSTLGSAEGISSTVSADKSAATFVITEPPASAGICSYTLYGSEAIYDFGLINPTLSGLMPRTTLSPVSFEVALTEEQLDGAWPSVSQVERSAYSDTVANLQGDYEVVPGVYTMQLYLNAAGADDPTVGVGVERTSPNAKVEVKSGAIDVTLQAATALGAYVNAGGSAEGIASSASGADVTFSITSRPELEDGAATFALSGADAGVDMPSEGVSASFASLTLRVALTEEQLDEAWPVYDGNGAPFSGVESIAPGTYSVTANLYVPGEVNPVLEGVNAYTTQEKFPPLEPAADNATLTVSENGTVTLELPLPCEMFRVKQVGGTGTSAVVMGSTFDAENEVTFGEFYDKGRITNLTIQLNNLSTGYYRFDICKEYATPVGRDLDVRLDLKVDLANLKEVSERIEEAEYAFHSEDRLIWLDVVTEDKATAERLESATLKAEPVVAGSDYNSIKTNLAERIEGASTGPNFKAYRITFADAGGKGFDFAKFTSAKYFHNNIKDSFSSTSMGIQWYENGNAIDVPTQPTLGGAPGLAYEDTSTGYGATWDANRDGIVVLFNLSDGTDSSREYGVISSEFTKSDPNSQVTAKGVFNSNESFMTPSLYDYVQLIVNQNDQDERASQVSDALSAAGLLPYEKVSVASYGIALDDTKHRLGATNFTPSHAIWKFNSLRDSLSYSIPIPNNGGILYIVNVAADGSVTAMPAVDSPIVKSVSYEGGYATITWSTENNAVNYGMYDAFRAAWTDAFEAFYRGATSDPDGLGYAYFAVVSNAEESSAPATEERLKPGTYTVTANVWLNAADADSAGFPVLKGIVGADGGAYMTNATNPNGAEGGVTGVPTSPVSDNATLVVADDGALTLTVPIANPVFTMQKLGTSASLGGMSYTTKAGSYGNYQSRIDSMTVTLPSAEDATYVLAGSAFHPTILASQYPTAITVPLRLTVGGLGDLPTTTVSDTVKTTDTAITAKGAVTASGSADAFTVPADLRALGGATVELVVEDRTAADAAALKKAYASQVGSREVAAVYEVDLEVLNAVGRAVGEKTEGVGALRLTLPVGKLHTGRTVRVVQLHKKASGQPVSEVITYDRLVVGADGTVGFTVKGGKLSEFIVALEPVSATNGMTSGTTGGNAATGGNGIDAGGAGGTAAGAAAAGTVQTTSDGRLAAGTYTVSANIWVNKETSGLPLQPHFTSAAFPPMNPVAGNATLRVDGNGRAYLTVPIVIQSRVMQVRSISGLPIVDYSSSDGGLTSITLDLGVLSASDTVVTRSCTASVHLGDLAASIIGGERDRTWAATFRMNFTGLPSSGGGEVPAAVQAMIDAAGADGRAADADAAAAAAKASALGGLPKNLRPQRAYADEGSAESPDPVQQEGFPWALVVGGAAVVAVVGAATYLLGSRRKRDTRRAG